MWEIGLTDGRAKQARSDGMWSRSRLQTHTAYSNRFAIIGANARPLVPIRLRGRAHLDSDFQEGDLQMRPYRWAVWAIFVTGDGQHREWRQYMDTLIHTHVAGFNKLSIV